MRSDVGEVVTKQRLATGKYEHRCGVDGQDLISDAKAVCCRQLVTRRFIRTSRYVTVSALQIAAAREVPRYDMRDVLPCGVRPDRRLMQQCLGRHGALVTLTRRSCS